MQEYEITSIVKYLEIVQSLEHQQIARWHFRGHGNCEFDLVPGLYRYNIADTFSTWENVEKYLMNRFRKEAIPHLGYLPVDDIEWLVLAQHHGLPTRLLDWSLNPLIAIYFATESKYHYSYDADVWCYGVPSLNNCLPESTYIARYINTESMAAVYYPPHITPRVTNQSGCFTIHSFPEGISQFIPFNKTKTGKSWHSLVRIKIPSSVKKNILNELYEIGIHKGVIYPGLDGISGRITFELETSHIRPTHRTELD